MSLVSAIKAPLSISNAIRKASQATGTDFSYLLKTAARESAFRQGAKAKTSSATGLFQFIESTWLKTVKEAGNKFGLEKYTPYIFKTQSGRHYVPNEKLRAEILQLRKNPEISAVMAGVFTQKNSEFIASKLGRKPTQGELYIAHFLGPKGASDLISLAENNPNARADRSFPRAARANKSIFYSRGRPRTAAQVYNDLVKVHAKPQVVADHPAGAMHKMVTANSANSTTAKPGIEPVKQATERTLAGLSRVPDSMSGADASKKNSIGLLGQKGSPIAAMTKVASLANGNRVRGPETMSDAAPGSIGVWATSVRVPANVVSGTGSNTKLKEAEPEPIRRRVVNRNRNSTPDRLLELSAKRNAARGSFRTASAADSFNAPDFWEQMAMNGN